MPAESLFASAVRASRAVSTEVHSQELPVVYEARNEVMFCKPCAPAPKNEVPVGLLLNMNELQNLSVEARDRMLRDRGVPQPRLEEVPHLLRALERQVIIFSRCGRVPQALCAAGGTAGAAETAHRARNCSGFGDPLFEAQLGYSCCVDRVRITDDEAGELQLQAWPQPLQGYNGAVASPLASLDMDEDRFRAYLQQRTAVLGANELGVAWTMPDGWTTTLLQLAMQRNLVGHVQVLIGIGAPLQGSLLGALRQAVRPGGSLELRRPVAGAGAERRPAPSAGQLRPDDDDRAQLSFAVYNFPGDDQRGRRGAGSALTAAPPSPARSGRRHPRRASAVACQRRSLPGGQLTRRPYGARAREQYGNLEVLELLLEYGACRRADGNGRLPATYAVTDEVRAFWAARGA